jgi:hypothetical protein
MAVRSALPWPFRWAIAALVLGFCAAIGLWAFEFGKAIAGVEGDVRDELQKARLEMSSLRSELATAIAAREKAQSVADTSVTLITAEKAAQAGLMAQYKQLEAESRRLRDDLGFFEKLIPSTGGEGIAVRSLQAEVLAGRQIKWQVLLIQAQKNAPDFSGKLEVSFAGTQNGKPWAGSLPGGPQELRFRQYGRTEGLFDLPDQTVVRAVSVKVIEGNTVKASQTVKV